MNKINETKLTLIPAQKVKVPLIKECYVHLECKLNKTLPLGDHTMFVGEVVNTLVDENAFKNDLLNNDKIQPTYYIGGNSYTTIDRMRKDF
jgi:flavin reductase (DIM6/NTAB) family NADH-FMN oxidoreductase RutF